MATRTIPVQPFDLVVFGATGDLAARKLFPALLQRDIVGQIPENARLIAAARRDMTCDGYRKWVSGQIAQHVGKVDDHRLARFLKRIEYVKVKLDREDGWPALVDLLSQDRRDVRAFYLAVSPNFVGPICRNIAQYGLNADNARVVVEKPVGTDLASAQNVNRQLEIAFEEHQIFRIDHYLGKETVQNLMALRFANALFEPLWNHAHIDHVQITVAESIGVGERAAYYDMAGAMRDMVQNHLLQLLCLVAMEPPAQMAADAVHNEKLKVLRALRPIEGADVPTCTVRGQYVGNPGETMKGYLEEVGDPASLTETFVALRADIQNWRWAGVPFYLRSGKRMAARRSEILVRFRHVPHSIFGTGSHGIAANQLVIRLQPNEGITAEIVIKDPGPGGMRLRPVALDMSFAEAFNVRNPDAYERLIMDVVRGNQTLFMHREEVEAAWRWIDPVIAGWNARQTDLCAYECGSWGPRESDTLIARDQRVWHNNR